MDLYMHFVSAPSRAVYATAKQIGIDFNIKTVNLSNRENRTAEYLKLNPSHTVPTLNDKGFVLFESRAIMTYLVNQYKPDHPLYPKDPKKRAAVDKVLHFDGSSVFSAIRSVVYPKFFLKKEPPQEAIDDLKERVSILGQMLGEQKFFTGDQVTLADISVGSSLYFFLDDKIVVLPDNIHHWYKRTVKEVPALEYANKEAGNFLVKFAQENK